MDGKLTAHGAARRAKDNLQSERSGAEPTELDQVVLNALGRSAGFQAFALPKRLLLPTFSRYDVGMQYATHVDSALMGGTSGEQVRSDLAMTLFLSEPDQYDGGELVIELPFGEQEIKLPAGEAVVYPATTLHRVNPITRGTRLAAIAWMQSAVPDERLRGILYDLSKAIQELDENSPAVPKLLKCYQNLLRLSAEI